ncbi:MAG: dephospho-CoA kinase [Candidatus Omnitrophota bacterium]|nr:dephospho-CoA kinase [Candidatus Omnitrophota bacterium]
MAIVGLTGGFGTGKSFVAKIFKKLGARIVDADKLAHNTLKKGSSTYKNIVSVFGRSILDTKGLIDRKSLGKIAFSDKRKIARLNSIIHPVVIKKIKDEIRSSKNEVLVVDAPLICETSLLGLVNVLVVVKSSREKQVDRCVKKFNLKKEDIYKRMECQMPLKAKIGKADYVVDNNGTRKETKKQVVKIWQDLKKGARVWR